MKDYKKILEGVVNIINTTEKSDIGFANICTYIGENCPELKESKDERIRKEILNYIDKATGCKRWVAWLEKQSNTNTFYVPKISIKNAVEVTSRMQYIDDDIKPIAEFIIDYANWDLHKDEWNQPTLTVPLFRVLDALIQRGKPYCGCNQNIEKQDEQNPADKAESKFKVGDYVVDNCGYIWRIEGIINQFYILEGIDGGESRPTIEWVNKTFHLWNISDAKDGDILVFKNNVVGIIICKSPTHYDTRSYCRLSIGGDFINEEESGWDSTQLIPASKEQRDQLGKVMADAGYVFDFEKKELKKIGHKSNWSEEDESNFQGIIDELKANKHHAPDYDLPTYDRFLSWFKSLKDRYTWKPSDEQMKVCKEVYADILSAKGFDLCTVNSELDRMVEKLKKLMEK